MYDLQTRVSFLRGKGKPGAPVSPFPPLSPQKLPEIQRELRDATGDTPFSEKLIMDPAPARS